SSNQKWLQLKHFECNFSICKPTSSTSDLQKLFGYFKSANGKEEFAELDVTINFLKHYCPNLRFLKACFLSINSIRQVLTELPDLEELHCKIELPKKYSSRKLDAYKHKLTKLYDQIRNYKTKLKL